MGNIEWKTTERLLFHFSLLASQHGLPGLPYFNMLFSWAFGGLLCLFVCVTARQSLIGDSNLFKRTATVSFECCCFWKLRVDEGLFLLIRWTKIPKWQIPFLAVYYKSNCESNFLNKLLILSSWHAHRMTFDSQQQVCCVMDIENDTKGWRQSVLPKGEVDNGGKLMEVFVSQLMANEKKKVI